MHHTFACKYAVVTLSNGTRKIQRQSMSLEEVKQYLLRVFIEKPGNMVSPCWEWPGFKTKRGYGVIGHRGRVYRVHRWFWEMVNGPFDSKFEVCHACDNPSCYNPEHLFLGTHRDNMGDAARKNRIVSHCGEKSGLAKLTNSQVKEIRRLYKPGKFYPGKLSASKIASRFGISKSMVYMIGLGHNWKHLL